MSSESYWRPSHNHITQSTHPVDGCPACALIRPEVMTERAISILRGHNAFIFGIPREAS
jgi:hypothetical protein